MMAHQSPWQSWWRWGMEKDQCYNNILSFHLRPSKLKVTEDFFFSFSWIQFHVGNINKQTGNVCGLSVRESVGYLLGLQVGWVGFQLNPTWILSTYLRQTKQKGKKKIKKKWSSIQGSGLQIQRCWSQTNEDVDSHMRH